MKPALLLIFISFLSIGSAAAQQPLLEREDLDTVSISAEIEMEALTGEEEEAGRFVFLTGVSRIKFYAKGLKNGVVAFEDSQEAEFNVNDGGLEVVDKSHVRLVLSATEQPIELNAGFSPEGKLSAEGAAFAQQLTAFLEQQIFGEQAQPSVVRQVAVNSASFTCEKAGKGYSCKLSTKLSIEIKKLR